MSSIIGEIWRRFLLENVCCWWNKLFPGFVVSSPVKFELKLSLVLYDLLGVNINFDDKLELYCDFSMIISNFIFTKLYVIVW